MNRPLIITAGIVIILLVIGLWVYLLIFGTPSKTQGVFADLGIMPDAETEVRTIELGSNTQEVGTPLGISGEKLQQLTTRPVAGFVSAYDDKELSIRYVESGTGHIYSINLNSLLETQLSVSTFPQTAKAIFSPAGSAVALIEYENNSTNVSVGSIDSKRNTVDASVLPAGAQNIVFKNESVIYFTLFEGSKTQGYAYDLIKETQSLLFTSDVPEGQMVWGNDINGIYIHTRPSMYLEGYIYKITQGITSPLPMQGFGLSAFGKDSLLVTSKVEDDIYTSTLSAGEVQTPLPISMLREKCALGIPPNGTIWCAGESLQEGADYLENWYKGQATSRDNLWAIESPFNGAQLVTDLGQSAGRDIDVVDLTIDASSNNLIFINKIDQTLWMHRI